MKKEHLDKVKDALKKGEKAAKAASLIIAAMAIAVELLEKKKGDS